MNYKFSAHASSEGLRIFEVYFKIVIHINKKYVIFSSVHEKTIRYISFSFKVYLLLIGGACFTIMFGFCQISAGISHGYTYVPSLQSPLTSLYTSFGYHIAMVHLMPCVATHSLADVQSSAQVLALLPEQKRFFLPSFLLSYSVVLVSIQFFLGISSVAQR